MYKWIGSIFIIVASCGIGISLSNELQSHLDALEEMKKIFCLLKSELEYTRAPFAEVFEKIKKKAKEPYTTWLEALAVRLREKGTGSFWEIWCETISEKLVTNQLKEEDKEELKNAGKSLEYIESIELYIEQLEYKIKHIREAYQSKKKLCRSMGIMGGIFLVILLL